MRCSSVRVSNRPSKGMESLEGHFSGATHEPSLASTVPCGQKQPLTHCSVQGIGWSWLAHVAGQAEPHSLYTLPLLQVGSSVCGVPTSRSGFQHSQPLDDSMQASSSAHLSQQSPLLLVPGTSMPKAASELAASAPYAKSDTTEKIMNQ